MGRSLAALHTVALAIWLGALVFSSALAGALFSSVKHPICPGCLKTIDAPKDLVQCETCGALEHSACSTARGGCALEHAGAKTTKAWIAPTDDRATSLGTLTLTGTSSWTRVRVGAASDDAPATKRLLWRLDGATAGLTDSEGKVLLAGTCWEEPRPAVGDALGRSFDLSQFFAFACGAIALITVFLTPPGGALRFLRAVTIAGAIGLAVWSLVLAGDIAAKRLIREAPTGETPEQREAFGKAHGKSLMVGLGELGLVLVGLALAGARRAPSPAGEKAPLG